MVDFAEHNAERLAQREIKLRMRYAQMHPLTHTRHTIHMPE